jgi:hypothetical protein
MAAQASRSVRYVIVVLGRNAPATHGAGTLFEEAGIMCNPARAKKLA